MSEKKRGTRVLEIIGLLVFFVLFFDVQGTPYREDDVLAGCPLTQGRFTSLTIKPSCRIRRSFTARVPGTRRVRLAQYFAWTSSEFDVFRGRRKSPTVRSNFEHSAGNLVARSQLNDAAGIADP